MADPVVARNRALSRADAYGRVTYRSAQNGYSQARPIDRVLPYYRKINEVRDMSPPTYLNVGDADSISHVPEPLLSDASTVVANRAYEKLRGMVSNAQAGVNIVEYRQARDMFTKRGKDFLEIVLLLLRGKFATAGRKLGCNFFNGKPPRRNRSKWVLPDFTKKTNISLSNLWLEWHFGVSPLISDCQDAAKVLTDPIPSTRVRGRAQEFVRFTNKTVDNANPGTYQKDTWVTRVRYQQGADIGITNPNVALAGQLGLLNPASLLWEIVPFSFVVDWFVNVGDWLQGFSDFAGMTLRMACRSRHVWTFHDFEWNSAPLGGTPHFGYRKGKCVQLDRAVGISAPTLSVRPLKLPSLSRALTSWSLLSQLLQRH